MRPVIISLIGSPMTSNVVPIDNYISPSNMGIAVVVSGTITYKVQYTFDNVFAQNYVPASGNWFDHPTLTGSASLNSNIAYPVTGIRLTTSAGTGTATMTIIQAGGGGNA